MKRYLKRTWAEIDLNALAANYRRIRGLLSVKTGVMSVVKANAYGHGAVEISQVLQEAGSERFAVSNLDEAVQLRRGGITRPILILGRTEEAFAGELAANEITQTVCDFESARELSLAARKAGVHIRVHVKTDTGMSRLGILCSENTVKSAAVEIEKISMLGNLELEGIFTHFSTADEPAREYTELQYARFAALLSELSARSLEIPVKHCANSAAAINYPEMHLDFVRPGIILYGMYPDGAADSSLAAKIPLSPVMQLKSTIAQIKDYPADVPVSYGRRYITPSPRRIAVVPIGYADGFSRRLSGSASVLIHGRRAPVVGSVCMDMCMVDISEVYGARTGDTVTVFGTDGSAVLPAEELAAQLCTINYEITCLVGRRVLRVYQKDGRIVSCAGVTN